MSEDIKTIPDGYTSITAYLIVKGADSAIEFYRKIFGAEELFRLQSPDGTIGHAELQIGSAKIMIADECPEMDILSADAIGGSPVSLLIYVDDVNTVFNEALEAGARMFKPLCDQFYGDRAGTIEDPFGHRWTIATRIEDVSTEVVQQRFLDMIGGGES